MSRLAAYRAEGERHLRLARDLSVPRKTGRPRKGEVREGIHDRAAERAKALRRARYWYATAARLALVHRAMVTE